MAKKQQPDYKKAFKESSAALTAMKIERGDLHGFYLGSGDRAASVDRLRRWCDLAEQHLSTEMIDQMAMRIQMYMTSEALHKGDEEGPLKWHRQWQSELMEDKQAHRQVQ
jgi:hypothetical protein